MKKEIFTDKYCIFQGSLNLLGKHRTWWVGWVYYNPYDIEPLIVVSGSRDYVFKWVRNFIKNNQELVYGRRQRF